MVPRPAIFHPAAAAAHFWEAIKEITEFLYHGKHQRLEEGVTEWTHGEEKTLHPLSHRPQCPECGDPMILLNPPKPIMLQDHPLQVGVGGGYRTLSGAETYRKYERQISPLTGIAPYIKVYSNHLEGPIHNYSSGRNRAMQSSSMFWMNLNLRTANGGKGKTEQQAQTGALCEAIERYSLMYIDPRYSIQGSFEGIPDAIHPNDCMLFSNKQIAERNLTNPQNTMFHSLVPISFDQHLKMDWTPVFSLTQKKFKYLPSCYCYAQYPGGDESNLFAYPDTNGAAAGNTLEEAILQGILELIERDAAAIWWYNQIPRRAVDLKSANNPYFTEVMAYYRNLNRSITVLDIRSDLNIPVFAAISHDLRPNHPDEIIYAFGAHVDPAIALERAVIELNQILPIAVHQGSEFLTQDETFLNWLRHRKMDDLPHFNPISGPDLNITSEFPNPPPLGLLPAIEHCMKATEEAGLETLVLDLTQPDIGLNVAKVIVPGLRHMWRRTAPGRLYEVPEKMGWLPKKLQESELNSDSIFI